MRMTAICERCGHRARIVNSQKFKGMCVPCYESESARSRYLKRVGKLTAPEWTPQDRAIVGELYPETPREKIMAALPGRSWEAIKRVAGMLGIKRLKRDHRRWEHSKPKREPVEKAATLAIEPRETYTLMVDAPKLEKASFRLHDDDLHALFAAERRLLKHINQSKENQRHVRRSI